MYPKKNYSNLCKILFKQIESKELPCSLGKRKVMFTLGKFKKVAMVSRCLETTTPENSREKVWGYVCLKKKQELVRDVLYSIYGDDWKHYEKSDERPCMG